MENKNTVAIAQKGIKYQFTMFSEKYKPIACVVYAENRQAFVLRQKPFKDALIKLCCKRSWTLKDLDDNGYVTWKVRKVVE